MEKIRLTTDNLQFWGKMDADDMEAAFKEQPPLIMLPYW